MDSDKNLSVKKCVYCGTEQTRIATDQKLKDGSIIYVDCRGKRWAGRRCPNCERKRV